MTAFITVVVTAILSAISAFLGARFAARFNLERFYREKTWERRAAVYSSIFDALHDQAEFMVAVLSHIAADEPEKVSERVSGLMVSVYKLHRILASEAWIISQEFRDEVVTLAIPSIGTPKPDMSQMSELLRASLRRQSEMMDNLSRVAQKDLSIK